MMHPACSTVLFCVLYGVCPAFAGCTEGKPGEELFPGPERTGRTQKAANEPSAPLAPGIPNDPARRHAMAKKHNWDSGVDLLRKLIRDPATDRGTALLVYWHGRPEWYLQYSDRSEVPGYEREVFDLLQEIEEKYTSGFYRNARIYFDPRHHQGRDLTGLYPQVKKKRSVPEIMLRPSRRDEAAARKARAESEAERHRKRAAALFKSGRHREAIDAYTAAIDILPRQGWLYGMRAKVHSAMDRHDRAVDDYTTALRLSPQHTDYRFYRAVSLVESGKWKESLPDLSFVINAGGNHAWLSSYFGCPAHYHRARAHRALGQLAEAEKDLRATIDAYPEYAKLTRRQSADQPVDYRALALEKLKTMGGGD